MSTVFSVADWKFQVDTRSTAEHTVKNSTDHCLCAYCRNYYETVDLAYPRLRQVLGKFGITMEGPSELMPLEPAIVLACYRVKGKILQSGDTRIYVDDVRIFPEAGDEESFLLWVGAMALPWVQEEPMEDVLSPANEPEFLDRMARKWMELTEEDLICS